MKAIVVDKFYNAMPCDSQNDCLQLHGQTEIRVYTISYSKISTRQPDAQKRACWENNYLSGGMAQTACLVYPIQVCL